MSERYGEISLAYLSAVRPGCPVGETAGMTRFIKKLTPLLTVESIAACLSFWVDRLGFEKTLEVPEGDSLAFVILAHDSVEVMLQTHASIAADAPQVAAAVEAAPQLLYVEVSDLDALKGRLDGVEVVIAERRTFYGSREIGVRDPGGHSVIFAEMTAETESGGT